MLPHPKILWQNFDEDPISGFYEKLLSERKTCWVKTSPPWHKYAYR